MWWKLPTEIVDEILLLLSFDDYVAVTRTSAEVRRVLDNQRAFEVVFHANFLENIEDYAWEIDPNTSRISLLLSLRSLRRFLLTIDSIYPTKHILCREGPHVVHRDETIRRALQTFASDPKYFIPLVIEFRIASTAFERSIDSPFVNPFAVSVSKLSWVRKLLQIQNFLHAVRFFMAQDAKDTSKVEQCYFELSRCYIDFPNLAPHRVRTLKSLHRKIRAFLPMTSGILKFNSENAYRVFICEIIKIIVATLNVRSTSTGIGGNILRAYKGIGKEVQAVYVAIIAKILQEQVFANLTFDVGGEKRQAPDVIVTPFFLILDSFFLLIDFESNSWSVYGMHETSRLPLLVRNEALRSITTQDVLETTFEADENSFPVDLLSQDWANIHYSTNIYKLRFFRTMITHICEHKSLDISFFMPLINLSDFFLYFYAALVALDPAAHIPSFQEQASNENEPHEYDVGYDSGDVVVNQPSDYFGVVLCHLSRSTDGGRLLSALPFDSIEKTVALERNVTIFAPQIFGGSFDKFLKWLLSTDGINYVGMFLSSELTVTSKKLSFHIGPRIDNVARPSMGE